MCDERIRLFYGVVLSEGHKIDVFRVHKQTDVFARRTESIVCGEGQYNGHGDAQGGFYCHRDGCIRYGICNLRSGVSRARRDEHGIGKTLRANGFRFCDGVDNFSSADIFYALVKAFRRAETCIGRVRRFAHHGQHIPVLSQQSKLRESFFKCAERSAHGKGKRGHVDHYSSKIL